MKIDKNKKNSTTPQRISKILFLILIFLRVTDGLIPNLIFRNQIPVSFMFWYITFAYIFTVILVWINRNCSQDMNVDKYFVHLLILSGLLLTFSTLPVAQGVLTGITTAFVIFNLPNHLRFRYPILNLISLSKYILLSLLSLLPLILSVIIRGTKIYVSSEILISSFYETVLSNVVFEEFLFRGILWMYLKDFGLEAKKIIIVQGILFWISHYDTLISGKTILFLFIIPLLALLLGVIVHKSKSLAPSIVGHFIYNLSINIAQHLI